MEPQKSPEDKKEKDRKMLQNAAKLSGAGIQMGLTIYLGNLLGTWLDKKYNAEFWEITITLFAIFASMYAIIRQVNQINK